MSAVPVITSLPPELLDSVFNFLRPKDPSQKEDLRACSLVSRTWNALVKPHLFHTIVLTLRQPAAWRRVYQEHIPGILDIEHRANWKDVDGIRIPRRTLEDIHDFFNRSPIVSSSIRDLKLVQFPSRISSHQRRWDDTATSAHWYTEDDDCPLELLSRVLSLLPRLSILRLAHFLPRVAEASPIVGRNSLAGELSTIGRLFIDLARRDGQSDLSAAEARLDGLLGYLDDLSELHLANFTYVVTQYELERFPHPYLRHQRRLKMLTLDNCTMKPSFFDAVRESPAADTLEVLDHRLIMFPVEPDIRVVAAWDALVKKAGPHLKCLGYWIAPEEPALDLSAFTALQTLTLRLELHLTTGHETLSKLEAIVVSIPASVERLHFQVSTATTWNPHWVITGFLRVLVGLDSTLAARVEHGSLREIRFAFWPDRHQELDLNGICAFFEVPRPQFERLAALGVQL